MDALLLVLAGLIALGAALLLVRSLGPRHRVARLLASVPGVTIAEAATLAAAGRSVYVRLSGRIDSEAEFEDADHRPLVLRRTTIQVLRDGRWSDLEVASEVAPFELRDGLDGIAIDGDSIAEGLVVMPRESLGTVGDLGDRVADDVPDDLPARLIIEHVSSVEHAIALGIPTLDGAGRPRLGPGLGRPLILSTLEPAEAMRILAGPAAARSRLTAVLLALAGALIFLGIALLLVPGDVLAASPSPTPALGSDTRSAGEGPGFVGAIWPAFLAVAAVALVTIVATLVYVRMTGGRGGGSRVP